MMGHPLPNVLIVGPPKCGTTSLFKWLSSHPAVCGSRIKETYYLMDPGHVFTPGYLPTIHEGGIKGFGEYYSHYQGERVLLEATPHHFNQATALSYAQKHSARAIFILRSPAERIYSQFQFNRHALAEFKGLDFQGYVDILMSTNDSGPAATSPRIRYIFSTALGASTYHVHVQRWREALDPGNVYVRLFEELTHDPVELLEDLSGWLGIDASFFAEKAHAALNKSFRPRFARLHTALRRFGGHDSMKTETLKPWFSPFHKVKPNWLRNTMDATYFALQIRPVSVSAEDIRAKDRLREYFRGANRALDDLGINTDVWT